MPSVFAVAELQLASTQLCPNSAALSARSWEIELRVLR
jgi:hypothetical protein